MKIIGSPEGTDLLSLLLACKYLLDRIEEW